MRKPLVEPADVPPEGDDLRPRKGEATRHLDPRWSRMMPSFTREGHGGYRIMSRRAVSRLEAAQRRMTAAEGSVTEAS